MNKLNFTNILLAQKEFQLENRVNNKRKDHSKGS